MRLLAELFSAAGPLQYWALVFFVLSGVGLVWVYRMDRQGKKPFPASASDPIGEPESKATPLPTPPKPEKSPAGAFKTYIPPIDGA